MKQVSHNGCLENARYLHDLSQKGLLDAKLNLAKASVTERVSAVVPHCPMCKKQFQTDVSLDVVWSLICGVTSEQTTLIPVLMMNIGGTEFFWGLNPKPWV